MAACQEVFEIFSDFFAGMQKAFPRNAERLFGDAAAAPPVQGANGPSWTPIPAWLMHILGFPLGEGLDTAGGRQCPTGTYMLSIPDLDADLVKDV